MKHSGEELQRVTSMLHQIDLELSDLALEQILNHLDAVLVVNRTLNLTRITDRDEALRLHVIDSLSAIPEVSAAVAGRMLDIGSGGGFPGVPLAVATSRAADLLDSVGKKATAVAGILEELGLQDQICALAGRAEDLAAHKPAYYSVVVARAVSALPCLVELASPLLTKGGCLVALQGKLTQDDLARGDAVAALTGMRRVSKRELALPEGEERRVIVVYERAGRSSTKLPRRIGLAQHHPLA